jgi:hypothetical protein
VAKRDKLVKEVAAVYPAMAEQLADTIMSRCSYSMSAPTVRFLRSIEQLRLLPAADRRKLAASI